jgi:hypothetical protein
MLINNDVEAVKAAIQNIEFVKSNFDHITLAKILGCNYAEIDFISSFWNALCNNEWILISKKHAEKWFGYKDSAAILHSFIKKIKRSYILDRDYKIAYLSQNNPYERSYYLSTECFKNVLMRTKSPNGKKVYQIYNKVARLIEIVRVINAGAYKVSGYVYIITCKSYLQDRMFIIGKTHDLHETLNNYNKHNNNKYYLSNNHILYYVAYYQTDYMNLLFNTLEYYLKDYKSTNDNNYIIDSNYLHYLYDLICINHQDDIKSLDVSKQDFINVAIKHNGTWIENAEELNRINNYEWLCMYGHKFVATIVAADKYWNASCNECLKMVPN